MVREAGVYDYDGEPRVAHGDHIYYGQDILRESYRLEELPPDRRLDVLVSGGSMGGLFTAHALQQLGHDVDVYERTEAGKMKGRGAGIMPDPELLVYMENHGLAERDEVSVVVDGLDYLDHDGSVREHRDEKMWSTSWDTFYLPLREAVGDENYHMGHELQGVEQDDTSVTASFATGDRATGDILVASEGYASRTREQLLPEVPLQYAGYVAWRGVAPESELRDDLCDLLGDRLVIYHGPDFQFLTYPVPGARGRTERGERRINLVWYQNIPRGEGLDDVLLDVDGVQREGSLPPGKLRPEVRERQNEYAAERLPDPFVRLVENVPDLSVQCIYDLKVPRMVVNRVLLMGDGAFFVRPHLASGTSKAAADGFRLAEAMSTNDSLDAALDEWEETQLALGNRLVDMARERGNRYMDRG